MVGRSLSLGVRDHPVDAAVEATGVFGSLNTVVEPAYTNYEVRLRPGVLLRRLL